MKERLLKATEVAFLVGVAPKTLEVWYAFKRLHPDNEYAKLLPDYTQETSRGARLWKESDVEKIMAFQKAKPNGKGRNNKGLFCEITHADYYQKKKEKKKDGKKETNRTGSKRSKKSEK